MSLLLTILRKIFLKKKRKKKKKERSLKVCILSATDFQRCAFFFQPFPFGHWFPFICMKDKTSCHLQKWWKILLLFNFDLLAVSLPGDRPPSLCPTALILLIFTIFSPIVPVLRTLWCPSACWDGGDGKEVCLNTFFFFFGRPESQIPVCVFVVGAVAIRPDVHSFSWGGNRKENRKNHQPLNFMHHNSCVCEHCMWYRAAPS